MFQLLGITIWNKTDIFAFKKLIVIMVWGPVTDNKINGSKTSSVSTVIRAMEKTKAGKGHGACGV